MVTATLLLPILAFAQNQNGQGGNGNGQGGNPQLPEVNVAWVLIPVAGAALLVSARQFARRKG